MASAVENQNTPPDENLLLEFQTADIGQRVDGQELIEAAFLGIIDKINEKDLLGIQVIPNLKWPRKVQILCASQEAKNQLTIQGLDIYHRHIELAEPGLGVVKVEISNAPLWIPNDVIKSWVAGLCTVTEFRNERVTVQGQKRNCRSGNRHAYVKMLKNPLPPTAKLKYGETEFEINIWHYAQTHIKCRFCKQHVLKGHTCDRAPRRGCFNCGSEDHQKKDCQIGKVRLCYRCGSNDHLARDCRQLNNLAEFPLLGSPETGVRPVHGRGEEKVVTAQVEAVTGVPPPQRQDAEAPPASGPVATGATALLDHAAGEGPPVSGQAAGGNSLVTDVTEESQQSGDGESVATEVEGEAREVDMESHADHDETHSEGSVILSEGDDMAVGEEQDETQFYDAYNDENSLLEEDDMHRHVANIALIGGSNCRELSIEGDEEISLNTQVICEEGLKVAVAAEKLAELSPEERESLDLVVMHIGTCEFPLEKDEDAEHHVKDYVQTLSNVLDMCPNIQVVISSVLPQTGDSNERTNRQIQTFNEKLQALSLDEAKSNLSFCNNNVGFIDEQGVVDASLYRDSVHINPAGRNVLARSIKECSKAVFFREKLVTGFSPVK